MISRANWHIVVATPDKLVLRDVGPWDRFMTVTNDAENVVRVEVATGLLRNGMRLYYYDSEGEFTEILLRETTRHGPQFMGFRSAKE